MRDNRDNSVTATGRAVDAVRPSVDAAQHGVVGRRARILGTVALLLLVTACDAPSAPSNVVPVTPPPLVPVPLVAIPAPTVQVRVEGYVFDADNGAPIGGAGLTVIGFNVDGVSRGRLPGERPRTAMTEQTGRFVFDDTLPGSEWNRLAVRIDRDGYEPIFPTIDRAEAASVVLRLYPTLTVRPGESIETQISLNACYDSPIGDGGDGWPPCRRVVIESSPGESIEVELTPLDHGMVGLTTMLAGQAPSDIGFQPRMTVSTGVVWITGSPGKVRLTARRP